MRVTLNSRQLLVRERVLPRRAEQPCGRRVAERRRVRRAHDDAVCKDSRRVGASCNAQLREANDRQPHLQEARIRADQSVLRRGSELDPWLASPSDSSRGRRAIAQ